MSLLGLLIGSFDYNIHADSFNDLIANIFCLFRFYSVEIYWNSNSHLVFS